MSETPAEMVARAYWFHRIDLGDGFITAGVDNTPGVDRRREGFRKVLPFIALSVL
jgi:hypothetical protein